MQLANFKILFDLNIQANGAKLYRLYNQTEILHHHSPARDPVQRFLLLFNYYI